MTHDEFIEGFLAGYGPGGRSAIRPYMTHLMPVWTELGYTTDRRMGYVEGEWHAHRLRVIASLGLTPDWTLVTAAARETVPRHIERTGDLTATVKRQLDNCETTHGPPAKLAIATGVMWTLLYNLDFVHRYPHFKASLDKKLREFLTPQYALTVAQNQHLYAHSLAVHQTVFGTKPESPLPAPSWTRELRTRSGRVSQPPARLVVGRGEQGTRPVGT